MATNQKVKWVKVAEVAERLGLSRSSVYTLMADGRLPYAKFGKARRISEEDLEKFIEDSKNG